MIKVTFLNKVVQHDLLVVVDPKHCLYIEPCFAMSYRKILVYLVIACGLFSVSYSRSVQSEVNKDSNATRNSTIATGSPSSPFDGLTPVVITCAV